MGTKYEAVRMILTVVREWPDEEADNIRIDADGEVLTCRASVQDVIDDTDGPNDHQTWGFAANTPTHAFVGAKEPWFVPYQSDPDEFGVHYGTVIGMPITRLEFEVVKAGIQAEGGDHEADESGEGRVRFGRHCWIRGRK